MLAGTLLRSRGACALRRAAPLPRRHLSRVCAPWHLPPPPATPRHLPPTATVTAQEGVASGIAAMGFSPPSLESRKALASGVTALTSGFSSAVSKLQ